MGRGSASSMVTNMPSSPPFKLYVVTIHHTILPSRIFFPKAADAANLDRHGAAAYYLGFMQAGRFASGIKRTSRERTPMSKRIPPVLARLAVLCLCLAFATLSARAQSQATTGDIEGRVLDPNGAVVPNATVTARNEATGFERSANTDG